MFFQPEAARRSLTRYISVFLLRIHPPQRFEIRILRRGLRREFLGFQHVRTRLRLSAMSSAMSGASGRFFQYFFGISDRIALTLSRAGLKMLR